MAEDPAATEPYAAAFLERQRDTQSVANYLIARLASEKDPAKTRAFFVAIQDERFRDSDLQQFAKSFDPDRPVVAGRDAPPFSIRGLAASGIDPKVTYTPATFAGKVYLVDVWATWCGPCVEELPKLHELHERYGKKKSGKQLELLSVSMDDGPEVVAAFRKGKGHAMPWRHAFAGKQDEAALEVLTGSKHPPVPFYMLVDGHGKVVAASPTLRADGVAALVERLLK